MANRDKYCYLGQLKSFLAINSNIPERAEAIETARVAFKIGSVFHACQFIETRIELGLDADAEMLIIYDRILTLGYSLIEAVFNEEDRLEAQRQAARKRLTHEERIELIVKRSEAIRDERCSEPAGLVAFRQRQELIKAGERALEEIRQAA